MPELKYPKFNIIVAGCVADNDHIGIGQCGSMPWAGTIPEDMRHFRNITKGAILIMGHATWQSLPGKLPGREHIVIGHGFAEDGVHVVPSFCAAISVAASIKKPEQNIFVVGGESVYMAALTEYRNSLDKIYITFVRTQYVCDRYFPLYLLKGMQCNILDDCERYRIVVYNA